MSWETCCSGQAWLVGLMQPQQKSHRTITNTCTAPNGLTVPPGNMCYAPTVTQGRMCVMCYDKVRPPFRLFITVYKCCLREDVTSVLIAPLGVSRDTQRIGIDIGLVTPWLGVRRHVCRYPNIYSAMMKVRLIAMSHKRTPDPELFRIPVGFDILNPIRRHTDVALDAGAATWQASMAG